MAWAKVDDQWWAHPKVLGLSLPARGLWITALSWSCGQRKSRVPASFVRMLDGDEAVDELVEAGLWVPDGDGWQIHDWAEYQERPLSAKRAEAGRKGAQSRWQTDGKPMAKDGPDQGEQDSPPDGKPMAPPFAMDGKADGRYPSHPIPSQSLPVPSQSSSTPNPWYNAAAAALDLPLRGDHEGLLGSIAAKARGEGHPPEEILRRAALHLATFNFPMTPGSLNKRWVELGSRVVTATPAERKKIQGEIDQMRQREKILAAMGETA